MFKSLRVRASQGSQFITDLRKAVPQGFAGRPRIEPGPCKEGCEECRDACPTGAIMLDPLRIDLGKCVFCRECVSACPEGKIELTSNPRMASATREGLVIEAGHDEPVPVATSAALHQMFGRSLRLRQVSAGGCNGCELELNALGNVNFDLQRYGIEWVASPRHADALVLTGALTKNMSEAVQLAWDAMPDPKFIVLVGACAISGGLYEGGPGVDRSFLDSIGPALYVPGSPAHPLTFVHGILELLGIS
ncbi:MAG: NADH-quinone oxidoreductase subunit B family protein [Polyangiales bacterium]